jgi:hypothetical protein
VTTVSHRETVTHSVLVRVHAVDPQDGREYHDYLVASSVHDITLAWWLGSPKITEVVTPCPCGRNVITVRSAP